MKARTIRTASCLLWAASVAACSSTTAAPAAVADDGGSGASDGYSSPVYSDPNMWLCGGGAPHDYCLDAQTATEFRADGTQADVPMPRATSTKLDCFYVYPTVDDTGAAGNRQDFDNLDNILDPVLAQAAPFSQVCTVFAPYYHQATLASYTNANRDQYLDAAYEDVAEAFRHFIGQLSHGRDFALLGHSQGTHMLRRLLQREIEPSAELKSRLAVAILAGNVGDVVVPPGEVVGGSFPTIPLCTSADERGCVITFNSYAAGNPPVLAALRTDSTMSVGCTNPGALGGGSARASGSFFPTKVNQKIIDPGIDFGTTSTFAVYRDFFTTECKTTTGTPSITYLEIAAAPQSGDTRKNPVDFTAPLFSPDRPYYLGLHLLDYAFPMQDLVDTVAARAK